MIFKVTLNKRSIIILKTYWSPSHPEDTDHITSIFEWLDRRYNDTAILIFGDFNYRRDLIESKFSSLVRRGFKIIFDSNPEQYTRSQDTIKGTPRSYIDYFIIKNLRDFDLTWAKVYNK